MTKTTADAGRTETGFDIARALENFAHKQGFVAPQAFYIVGSFNLRERNGKSVYSDEAHLWCEPCAARLLKRARRLMPRELREDHFICATDASGEDSCPHCMSCGETLEGTVSKYCVEEELEHYAQHPIGTLNPRQAVEIAMICYAAPDNSEVLSVGRAALAAAKGAEKCERRVNAPGEHICDRCGSLWTDMLHSTDWLPLSCVERAAAKGAK